MKKSLLPIFLVVAVDILGLTIVLPLLPFYAEKYGASPFVVGLLVTSYALCQLISGPIFGRVSDRIGRRPLLLVSQIGTLIGFLILAFSGSLWMVFLSRIIDGSTAGNLSLAQAYISDVTEPKDRAKSFGIIGISFGLGFLIGPAISGFLSQYGYHYPILAAAFLSFSSILATYFFLPKHRPVKEVEQGPTPAGRRLGVFHWGNYSKYFKRPELSPLLLEFFLFTFAFSLFTSGFALFAERRFTHNGLPFGPKEVGYVFAYAGFLGIILQGGLIGKLVKRFGERALIVSGFLAAAVGYCLLGFTTTIGTLLAVTVITSYGTGVLRPAISSLVSQTVSRTEQGIVMGLTQSLSSISAILAPMCSGFLIGRYWLTAWAGLAGLTAFVGFVLSSRSRFKIDKARHVS